MRHRKLLGERLSCFENNKGTAQTSKGKILKQYNPKSDNQDHARMRENGKMESVSLFFRLFI